MVKSSKRKGRTTIHTVVQVGQLNPRLLHVQNNKILVSAILLKLNFITDDTRLQSTTRNIKRVLFKTQCYLNRDLGVRLWCLLFD